MSISDDLTKLADLRDRGVLTQDEFEVQKAKLLGSSTANPTPPPPSADPSASPRAPQANVPPFIAKKKPRIFEGCLITAGVIMGLCILLVVIVGSQGSKSNSTANTTASSADVANATAASVLPPAEKKKQIKALTTKLAGLDKSDLEGNLAIYKQLNALDPTNDNYLTETGDLESKILHRGEYADHPEKALTIAKFDWYAGGFGAVQMVSITVENDAPFDIKDFVVKCELTASSGTHIDENTKTVYEIVPAMGKKRFKELNMGLMNSQATSSNCHITDAVKV